MILIGEITLGVLEFSFFFFSSRRRHTRSYGDRSSDVCSSDLNGQREHWQGSSRVGRELIPLEGWRCEDRDPRPSVDLCPPPQFGPPFYLLRKAVELSASIRSEERRVGKECRSRWWKDHENRQ